MKILCGFMGQCIMAFHRRLLATIGRSVNETNSTRYRCLSVRVTAYKYSGACPKESYIVF